MLILAAALVVVFAAVLFTLKASLEGASGDAARARADQISAALASDGPSALDEGLFADVGSVVIAQVLDADGRIVRASPLAPLTPLTLERSAAGQQRDLGLLEVRGAPADYWVVVDSVSGTSGNYVVITGAFQAPTESTVWTVFVAFAIAWPFTVALAGWATFLLVGRAFQPVDEITGTVARIRAEGLSEQVPVPPSNDEIARLATTMNEMLTRLRAGLQAQRQFVGDASHELRSPLAGIMATLELAVHRPHTLDIATVESSLLPETRRMQSLIDDLLLLATADERGLTPCLVDVDLDDVVEEVVHAARLWSHPSSPRVLVRLAPVRLRGDAHQLSRMVRNLVDNAVRFADTTVQVTLTAAGEQARLDVEDDGPGIPISERRRVFDRFVRLDRDRSRAAGGAGLGLAIVEEVATAHGGTVDIEDSRSGGAQFVVRLPAENLTLPTPPADSRAPAP
ncbi:MAG: HAMP domain-containing sensor histidine kinase [Nakamurella sp.]